MPELPEVETVRSGLEPVMTGHTIVKAQVRRPDLRWPFPDRMEERLTGAKINRLGRRSKYLLIELDTDETLIVHLGMSGRMQIQGQQVGEFVHEIPPIEKHDHVVFDLDQGVRIVFNDARRFGAMDLCATDKVDEHWLIEKLGPEPQSNDFNADHLKAEFANRRTPIKSALLDQRIIAGLGNIYVCEALWRAGISPKRLAKNVGGDKLNSLTTSIRDVIAEAIESGGSSLKDYRQADGELGYFQHRFAAYGREGESCQRQDCSGEIIRITQSGRSTFYCKSCQR